MTYCVSTIWDISFQKIQSLQIYCLHKLAKHFWEKFVLSEQHNEEEISFSCKTKELVRHRDRVLKSFNQVLCDLSEHFSTSLPKMLKREVENAIFSLQKSYYEALSWEKRYRYFLPFTIFNPVIAGKYHVSNFIGPVGQFNDLAWVKLYVTDEGMDRYCRFKMASFYCIEDVLNNVWQTLDSAESSPFVMCLRYSSYEVIAVDQLVMFWACKVANYFGEPSEEVDRKLNKLNDTILCMAFSTGNEYAIRHFWRNCSVTQKDYFLKNYSFHYIYMSARENLSGIVHFLYVCLSENHKNTRFFTENVNFFRYDIGKIWNCLLNSPFYKCVLNDILTFPESITKYVYFDIFRSLISNIELFNYPIQKSILKVLWKHCPEKEEIILKFNFFTTSNLIKLKEIDVIEAIFKPLSCTTKDMILLHDLQGAGKSVLYELSKMDDYDMMLRYMLCFLIDGYSSTQESCLRVDANIVLENLKKDESSNWSEIEELAKEQICKNIDCLNECLGILNDVLDKL